MVCILNSNLVNCHVSSVWLQISLFIYLFIYLILVKHFYRFMLTLDTFEDVIQLLAVAMYMHDHMSVASFSAAY